MLRTTLAWQAERVTDQSFNISIDPSKGTASARGVSAAQRAKHVRTCWQSYQTEEVLARRFHEFVTLNALDADDHTLNAGLHDCGTATLKSDEVLCIFDGLFDYGLNPSVFISGTCFYTQSGSACSNVDVFDTAREVHQADCFSTLPFELGAHGYSGTMPCFFQRH